MKLKRFPYCMLLWKENEFFSFQYRSSVVECTSIQHTVKMAVRDISAGRTREKMAKCRRNRGVTGFRPPPGGAHAAQIVTS